MTATMINTPSFPVTLGDEYLDMIADAIKRHPRSQQIKIGPSEIGHPCARRLGYKLLGTPERDPLPNWKATVGTAMHTWLEDVFEAHNQKLIKAGRPARFYLEQKVSTGYVDGDEIVGSCDLFDLDTNTVTDWKTCGPTQLKKYRSKGPGDQYRTQANLYGRGWAQLGYPVDRVQIVFLPRNGELAETFVWSDRYDESVALAGLTRVTGIAIAVKLAGPAALANMPTTSAWCNLCPFFRHRSDDLTTGCPGDPTSPVHNVPEPDEFPFGRP